MPARVQPRRAAPAVRPLETRRGGENPRTIPPVGPLGVTWDLGGGLEIRNGPVQGGKKGTADDHEWAIMRPSKHTADRRRLIRVGFTECCRVVRCSL